MTRSPSSIRPSQPSRREVLQIFAAGASAAVGTITLAPLSNVVSAQSDDTLRIAWLTPAQLDPRSVSGMSEIAILNALYDYLFETDAGSNLVPVLASSWERSEDGARYTLHLVENAAFHDGSLLTASDVVWSIRWQLDAGGTIADILAAVESVEAVGDHTVVFQLNAPDPDFLYRLTEYKVVMLKAGAQNAGVEFNGTGPFIMQELIPGDRAIMRANENYWRGAPTIETLEFLFFDDQQAAIAAVQGGTADGILRLDNFSFLNFTGDFRFNTVDIPTNAHQMTRIRADRPPGNDRRVRQAFKLATDRRAVWERVQLGFGAVGKDSPIGPSFAQYFLADAEWEEAAPTLNPSSIKREELQGANTPLPSSWEKGPGDGGAATLMRVTDLSKRFPVAPTLREAVQGIEPSPIRAVDGVDLQLRAGQTLGLVGESGSGKTTLARVIIGLQERSGGKLELLGLDVRNSVRERSEDVLSKLQMVFQNPQNSLNPYLSARQAIRRPLIKLRGLTPDDADAEALKLLDRVNLRAEYAERYPDELSGGEKQRVAIARAFASEPDLIICDEPVSALDVSVQAAVLNLLAQLQEEHDSAYLFISHNLSVVGYLADTIAVMYLGQLFEVGAARDLFQPPYHPYTEALVSAIPVADPKHKTERMLLSDNLPSAQNLPSGCRFHTRCPRKIGEICETDAPPWREDEAGHQIRCHIPLDELEIMQRDPVLTKGDE